MVFIGFLYGFLQVVYGFLGLVFNGFYGFHWLFIWFFAGGLMVWGVVVAGFMAF